MQEGYLEHRGIAYRVNNFEAGRPTLLLLHGLSSSSSCWLPYEARWEQKYNLIIPDLRGHGRSRRYPYFSDYTMAKNAEDIDELLRHLRVEDCIIVGYSFGALMVLLFERLHKKRVKAAVLICPLYNMHTLWRVRLASPLLTLVAYLARLLPVRQKSGRVDYAKLQNLGDEDPRRMWRDISNTGLAVYIFCFKQILDFSRDAWWSGFSAPTLILYGTGDTTLPEQNISALAREIPHAKLKEFTDGSHMLVYNNVAEVSSAIEDCID